MRVAVDVTTDVPWESTASAAPVRLVPVPAEATEPDLPTADDLRLCKTKLGIIFGKLHALGEVADEPAWFWVRSLNSAAAYAAVLSDLQSPQSPERLDFLDGFFTGHDT